MKIPKLIEQIHRKIPFALLPELELKTKLKSTETQMINAKFSVIRKTEDKLCKKIKIEDSLRSIYSKYSNLIAGTMFQSNVLFRSTSRRKEGT